VTARAELASRIFWLLAFAAVAFYVAVRLGAFALSAAVGAASGPVRLPNTFASVDHPFHVARAETLWRTLGTGQLLRWIGQHQGGYPVEFYPLGEAWFEVVLRALSLGTLDAESAHTLAVILIFLLPGAGFAALSRLDQSSLAPAFLALALHISLPGGWYDGGYTELVQWGLVTNVAGATAAFLVLPLLSRYLVSGNGWTAALASLLAATAIYSNPRSLVGLVALGAGAWLAAISSTQRVKLTIASARLAIVAFGAALLAAPELIALIRFGGLYTFVQYSRYASPADYLSTTVRGLGLPVLFLAAAAIPFALLVRSRLASRSVALGLLIYMVFTLLFAFVPFVAQLATQLEPTRLMPLQRLLTIYLAASAAWAALSWIWARFAPRPQWAPVATILLVAAAVLITQTRVIAWYLPDPASSAVPQVSLYPVVTSATPQQADLEAAVRAADAAALSGTALLIVGSALSWHQPLWAPLWTQRPLYYDDWLWYWHPYQAGTPGYRPAAGNAYPDPENTLDRRYLAEHGIGAVVVTGNVRNVAARSPLLQPIRQGIYDAYLVRDPVTTVTFGTANAKQENNRGQQLAAQAATAQIPVIARVNWFPRWSGSASFESLSLTRRNDGYIEVDSQSSLNMIALTYNVQGPDWLARGLAVTGVALILALTFRHGISGLAASRWYPPQ
jgi:hypothetical protein